MDADALASLQTAIGWSFADAESLERALVHRSYCAEHPESFSNERLEFLGDAVLGMVVTDGFTGNVALKTMEGSLRAFAGHVFTILDSTPEAREAAKVIMPMFLDAATTYDPDSTGGAVLLGIKGVSVISHGSSSARAIVSAIGLAADCVATRVPERIKEVIDDAG